MTDRPSFLQRLREAVRDSRDAMRGSYDWYSAPNHRTARGEQPDREFLIPYFSNRDDFSPGLYACLYVFDVEDLGFHFCLQQWGCGNGGGGNETGSTVPSNYVRLVYTFPQFENPTKAIELEQVDIAKGSKRGLHHGLSDEGRQEALLLSLKHNLYASSDKERWLHHMDKRTVTLDAIPETPAILDYWRVPTRGYCIMQVFVNDVRIQAALSGFDREEAASILERLAPIAGHDRLAEWHDTTIRQMQTIRQPLGGSYAEGRGHT